MKNTQYIEISSLAQVLGCIYKNPKILDADDKYKFNEEDFYDNFHKLIFSCLNNLWQLGVKEFTIPAIEDYLEQKPKALALYKTQKGRDFLLELGEIVNLNTFHYYYNRMKKMTLLRAYEDMGMDLTWLYNPSEILNIKKKQEQEEWLDNASLEDIYNKINDKIDIIKEQYVSVTESSGCQIGEGIDELLESYKQTPAYGYPLYGDYINGVTRGARLGRFYLRSGSTGVGKALPNYLLIPTPIGWRKVGDIKEGDFLFDANGKPTKVLKVYPQQEKKKEWELIFSGGSKIRRTKCCKDHLWEVYTNTKKKEKYIKTTEEIYNEYLQGHGKYRVKATLPVQYEEKKLATPPYLMGVFLASKFRTRARETQFTLYANQKRAEELFEKLSRLLGDYLYKKEDRSKGSYYQKYEFRSMNNLNQQLQKTAPNILHKQHSYLIPLTVSNIFIPHEYLQGSVEQRLELLRGFLDVKGTFDRCSGCRDDRYVILISQKSVINTVFLDNLRELFSSLGLAYRERRGGGKAERIIFSFILNKGVSTMLSSLSCVQEEIEYWANGRSYSEIEKGCLIQEIIPTDNEVDMTCFTVDNPDHLFLINHFIPTHNTRAMIGDICYIGGDQIYNTKEQQWTNTQPPQSCLYIATEQDLQECQSMCVAFLAGVNEENILTGEYYQGEWDRVKKAAAVLKKSKIQFECIPDFNLEDIENLIKKHIRENDIKYCAFDYIHSSAKILTEVGGKSGIKNLREDNVLFLLSSKLKDMCVKYGIFILSSTQLNGTYKTSDTPDQTLLRG